MIQIIKKNPLLVLTSLFIFAFSSFAFYTSSSYVASVEIHKMNVIYIGVDNPVSVAIAGVSTGKTRLESEELEIEEVNVGEYILKARKPGRATLKIYAKDELVREKEFRIKRIPDPIAKLNNSRGGRMKAGLIHQAKGIVADIECFDFDAKCAIRGYHVTLVREGADPIEMINPAGEFSSNTKKLIESAQVGDIFYFDTIKCLCPGDKASRAINSLVFKII